MRDYEVILIVHPELDDAAFNEVIEKFKGWISASGGIIDKTDIWGKKRMAYPIRKQTDGHYVLFHVSMMPSFTIELDRNLRLIEPVLRYLITTSDR